MNYLQIILFSIFLISCGGGSSYSTTTPQSPAGPTGNISGQVDPVQST